MKRNTKKTTNSPDTVIDNTSEQVAADTASSEMPQGEDSPVVDVAQLQADLAEMSAKVDQLNDAYLRQVADYQNLKRRTQQQMDEIGQYKLEGFVKKLLGVVDNFERAMQVDTETASVASVLEGITMVRAQLMKILTDEGVEVIETDGVAFDPNRHEAMMRVPAEEGVEDDTIVLELERGYTLNKRVIRASKVGVAKAD